MGRGATGTGVGVVTGGIGAGVCLAGASGEVTGIVGASSSPEAW